MADVLFNINRLSCSYTKNEADKALYIEKLEIFQGELIFLLGSSGSGKSTLLETLGLMNNTAVLGSIQLNIEGKSYLYNELWRDSEKLSFIRKKYFSFIFQNTNLMENFTAYENVCLPRMIQQDVSQAEVMPDAEILMQRVGLPRSQVSPATLAMNLSGGQRQRLSFVRALSSNCTVLFCDEPTGNLDENNATELMTLIDNSVRTKNITAIVVSHDIDLALDHASRIICLRKEGDNKFGIIHNDNTFVKSQWENLNHEERFKFREKIKGLSLAQPEMAAAGNVVAVKDKGDFKAKFHRLFLLKEGLALASKRYLNLFILFVLLFFTFLSIGFANGSLAYLDKQLNNAFVNWLTVSIPASRAYDVPQLIKDLNDPALKYKYSYKDVRSFGLNSINFKNVKNNEAVPIVTRNVQTEGGVDPVIEDITKGPNLLRGKDGFISDKDLSLIVTEKFLEDLGYSSLDVPYVFIEADVLDSSGNALVKDFIPVGVRSIVKAIPGKVECAYTTYFDKAFNQSDECTFDKRLKSRVYFFIPGGKEIAHEFKSLVEKSLKISSNSIGSHQVSEPDSSTDTWMQGFELNIDYFPLPATHRHDSVESLYNKICADKNVAQYISDHHIIRTYNLKGITEHFGVPASLDKLSVNFDNLDKVRDFAIYIDSKNTKENKHTGALITVDQAAIRDKENFNFLSRVTYITSAIIILISTVAVCLFIFNLLRMHLAKVKMNIGTFTATGLSNLSAQMIYFQIIVLFVLVSFVLSILAAWGTGILLDKIVRKELILDKDVSYFKIGDTFTWVTALFIFVFSLIVSYFTIRRVLSKSPGDLINNR